MKKNFYLLIAGMILGVIAAILLKQSSTSNSWLRETEETIKRSLFELTPIGMSMEDVLDKISNNEEWEIRWVNSENGFMDPSTGNTIGKKSIRVFIGKYQDFFVTHVTVFWGFNENSELIDIYVWKDTEGF